jgi:hypothetical protein
MTFQVIHSLKIFDDARIDAFLSIENFLEFISFKEDRKSSNS